MGDFLEALDALLKHILDLVHDVLRVVVVLRHELVGLADQIELEERLRVFVPGEVLVDLLLYLFSPCELIFIDVQVTFRLI